MARIQLFHHVYSSHQGYRTIKASPDLPPTTVEVLEEFSDKTYPKAKRAPRFSVFPPDEIFLCCSMNALSGVDHVGRKRSLVHNILVRREEVQRLSHFNHLQLPQALFLKPGGDLQRDVKHLAGKADLDEEKFAQAPSGFDRDKLPRKCVLHLLRVLLSDKPCIIRSEKNTGFERLQAVSALVPAVIREPLAVVNGMFLPDYLDLGHPTVFLVGPDFDLSGAVREGFTALDTAGQQGYNLPRPHPWDRFVVGHLTAGDASGSLSLLLKVINRYRPLARYTPQAFNDLVSAFEQSRACFEESGRLDVKRAPADGLGAVEAFFKAGHPDIVFDIFLGCLQILGARELLEPIQQFGGTLRDGASVLAPLFQEIFGGAEDDPFDFDDDFAD